MHQRRLRGSAPGLRATRAAEASEMGRARAASFGQALRQGPSHVLSRRSLLTAGARRRCSRLT